MGIDKNRHFEVLHPTFVRREEWGALPAGPLVRYKEYPINWLDTRFTDTEECFSREECARVLRDLQRRDMDQGFADVRYNFMVGGDWSVYEGRGWKYVPDDPPVEDLSGIYFDIAYIGPYPHVGQKNYPYIEMKLAQQRLIEFGIVRGYIDSNFNQETHDRLLFTRLNKPMGDPSWRE